MPSFLKQQEQSIPGLKDAQPLVILRTMSYSNSVCFWVRPLLASESMSVLSLCL